MPAEPARKLPAVPRRFFSLLLSGLVVWASLAAIDRISAGAQSTELRLDRTDQPAIHHPVRPETRLGRAPGPRGLDLGPVVGTLAAAVAVPSLPTPCVRRARDARLETFRAGCPVSPSRGSRGPPGRLS